MTGNIPAVIESCRPARTDRRSACTLWAAIATLCVPNAAFAQAEAEQEASADQNEIVVTARRPRESAIGEAEPIAVLDAAAIRALGATSLSQMLQRLGSMTKSASGSDPVFLLNGQRISGMEEIQTLPPEAMERVEILSEQDAARFGFPPTVRVVNFITKKRFRSLAVQQLAGVTTEGGGGTEYAEAVSTRIDGTRRSSLSMSYFRHNPVWQDQRAIAPDPDLLFSTAGTVTGLNGGSIDPALDALAGRPVRVAPVPADPAARGMLAGYAGGALAGEELGAYRTLLQRQDKLRVEGTLAAPLSRTLRGSLNLALEAQRSHGSNGLAPAQLRVPGTSDALPFANDVLLYRYFPDTVLRQTNTTLDMHAAATLYGSVARWMWNASATYDRVRNRDVSDQGVRLDAFQAAVDAGGDPLAPLPPEAAAQRIRLRSGKLTETLVSKAVANGPLVALPAGEALVTVTADYTRASTEAGPQEHPSTDNFQRLARRVAGASVSAEIPIASADRSVLGFLGRLSANGMVGVSDVPRFGQLVSTNFGLNWAPLSPVQFSVSVNDARTPPAVDMLASPLLVTPNTPFFDFITGASILVTTVSGGNPALDAERRQVTKMGVSVKPLTDTEFRINLDYVDTQIHNQASYLGALTPDFLAAFPDLFERDPGGMLVRVDRRPVNIARESEQKLRLGVNFFTQIGRTPPPVVPPAGALVQNAPPPPPPKQRPFLYGSVTIDWRLADRLRLRPGSAPLDLLDGATLSGTGGRPRWEIDANLGGSLGAASLGVYGRLQGPTRIRSELAASDLNFTGRTWLVAYGSLDMSKVSDERWAQKLSLQLTVENLLNDRIDVRDRNGATPNRFQGAYLDPLGRSIRLGLRKLF
ncbi:TonB-dependent receptor [Sphingomonas sp. DG1-23]|uniref:TonB-dependent receptor n=1 Tax=Sphingomonas sp. DG1-23 TaxID=3068316 RepID=UPI00273EC5AC|nr:TonB-dependent receptor [Sphingomonas sp. DG1-23]MDP5280714.1 TonB-dependent receptor [Sphingomonas sp. DG1-23]